MKGIEHIGIAVRSIQQASAVYSKLLGEESYKQETIDSEAVVTLFFKAGDQKIELLEASSPDSVIAKFIEKKGEGLHHIAFKVDDIYAEIERLEQEGFKILPGGPKVGADNKLVCFVHPKDTTGVLVELCQDVDGG